MENNLKKLINEPYKYGFSTNIETEKFPYGITEDIVKLLSKKKNEPEFLLKFRLKSYKQWKNLIEPEWSILNINKINYQNIVYYSVPKKRNNLRA
jgi:Fe-S cluster assembly protein SufB